MPSPSIQNSSQSITKKIAQELNVKTSQIEAAVLLLDNGDTVPFIARYRKEATGGLSDTDLRTLEERLLYLRELEERRAAILKSIEEQGKLTEELTTAIMNADTKARLEDLYLPYKPKRRTKAQIAREAGLEPLALSLYNDPTNDPETLAATYINLELNVPDTAKALEGARHILMENFSEDADLIGKLRNKLWDEGELTCNVVEGKEEEGQKFKDYFDYSEKLKLLPSHRILAILRGRNESFLSTSITSDPIPYQNIIAIHFNIKDLGRAADAWLLETVRWTWKFKIFLQLEVELMGQLKTNASDKSIQVFSANLRDLLMSAPAGAHCTLGLDPGYRTGVKVAIVDATGKVLAHSTIYPHAPKNEWNESLQILASLCRLHQVELISIGNGTASRETDQLASDLIKKHPELNLKKIVVSEAGASVYSASKYASEELPELDVSIRGAVSIARRLQDPLAELVKIEPKSIGVGQYQHDVFQGPLARALDLVVEDCVNAVGVDVNTASIPLLSRVSGLNTTLAKNIVEFRDSHGKFKNRKELTEIPRLGAKTFEQAAGFLRIIGGENPLDCSAVHPEAYPVVERIITKTEKDIHQLIGNKEFLSSLNPKELTDEKFGLPTVIDILHELEKPGRDPRPEFKTAQFNQNVHTLEDLKIGMILEGVVTNVADFGAFVDIGVHQDGLVHVSALSNRFVKNPREIVKAGDIVTVKVMDIDLPRKRISLSMRLEDDTHQENRESREGQSRDNRDNRGHQGNRENPRANKEKRARENQREGHHPGERDTKNSLFGDALKEALKKTNK